TLNYQGPGTGLFAQPSRRHRYTFAPVTATGIRLLVPATALASGTCIDELEVNPPDTSGDVAFGAELVLTATLQPAVAYQESEEEWVELYNRSTNAVDLAGWRLDAGIDFRFTNGPILAPGGYLVVARDAAALRSKWPDVAASIIGNFSGRLRAHERFLLRDAVGNPVNETRVFEGGWSDGGGSTLELRDPFSDNSTRDAWADSDETAKGQWQTVSYRMDARQSYGPTRWREFRLGLLDDGQVLVDAVSVIRDPDGARQELIQNGNFETTAGNTHWRFLGTHSGEFVTDPDNAANHVLKITAGGRALMNHNHIESTFVNNTALVDNQVYEVSYRARWLAGSPQLSSRAYFSKLARVTALPMPTRLGTPAAPNSRAIPNAGPTFAGLRHSPVMPDAGQPVTISVLAADPQGVAQVTLFYRVNPAAVFASTPMAQQPDGRWSADLPAQTAGKIVQFYVQAQDALGAAALAPPRGPDSRALYQVTDAQRTSLPIHELRLIMLDADRDFMLNPTNVMSNARLGGTVIYDRTEVFYDAGPRLQGTAASRIRDGDNYISYDIGFPPDHLFRGMRDNVGIDRSGRAPTVRAQDEIYVQHMFRRAGLPCQYTDLCYFIAPRLIHTGTAILQLAAYDGSFVDEQYGQAGSVFNMDITYEPDTTTDGGVESIKLPVPLQAHIGTDFTNLGNDPGQYRSPFDIRVGNRRDDYAGLIRLCQTAALPQIQFDDRIGAALDVEESLRTTALYLLCGIQDNYLNAAPALPHNLRLFTPADGGPAQLLAWDMDFVFGAATSSPIFPYSGINLAKLVNNPNNRRSYLRHVYDLCQNVFNTDYMSRWLTHYGSLVGQNYSAAATYITGRRAYALSQLPAAVPFAITINNGNDFLTNSALATITGRGWLDIREIRLDGTDVPLSVSWSTPTDWQATVPLVLGTNYLSFVALGSSSNVIGTDSITVTTTASTGGVDSDGDG
ncbi:MAG TPA: lamin tail domain-containing protein, partial [Candidatus Dormibacteraeota bacterium]|nr:lamin tail domain-containing protein [Candidatus Dormibacteraeota bacterium]